MPPEGRASRARNLPLPALAERLGYQRDPRNRRRWRLPGSVLSIDGQRFFDHRRGCGGGGAIDLVMHARGCSFLQALDFLLPAGPSSPLPPPTPAPAPAPPPARALRLPPPCPRLWPAVQEFLVSKRGLCPRLVSRCHRQGILWADARRNAVFLCRAPDGTPTGAELLGSRPRPFKAMAAGSRKARGAFWVPLGPFRPRALLLVESALDALSAILVLQPPADCLAVSTAGLATRLPLWLRPYQNARLACGFDADPPGDHAAASLSRQLPALRRLRPQGAKDWNDLLCLPLRPAPPAAPRSRNPA